MDGSTVDHSDSDSGESWTLLENHPTYGEDAPDFPENSPTPFERDHNEVHLEKDEDTDGISIISDSDPESGPCDITCNKCLSSENCPPQPQDIPHFLYNQQPPKKTIESICKEDDFLGDGSHKLKTYVHRRNKRLSMVLNIIMLGSVITAAGVAFGHMWGAKNECTVLTPSVNKILSNLYKLQEENAYLRNKLKELTFANNIQQMQQTKSDEKKKPVKQHRCRKVFEEPLNNKVEKAIKCVDQEGESAKTMDSELLLHEREFLNDVGKLKKVYNQNRSWLDEHIQRRWNHDNNMMNKQNIQKEHSEASKEQVHFKVNNIENHVGSFKSHNPTEHDEDNLLLNNEFRIPQSDTGSQSHKAWKLRKQMGATRKVANNPKISKSDESQKVKNLKKQITKEMSPESSDIINLKQYEAISNETPFSKETKISYADSLKTNSDNQKVHSQINDSYELPVRGMRGYGHNRKNGDVDMLFNLISSSEDDIKKDDRYMGPKIKRDKKKHDRHKIHKKQKRKNKYEQWEMKGGYMKDFDEYSMTSSKVNLGNNIASERKYLNHDFENYLAKLSEVDQNKKISEEKNLIKLDEKGKKGKKKDLDWYDKRYALRAEARRKLEHELFGESSPNTAAWYFRRVSKREQCRAQNDNTTFKKYSKQKMNYKMKH